MPSSRSVDRLRDIVTNCDSILHYTAGMDFEAHSTDQKTKDAVERCWQRISEASCRLGDYLDEAYPGVDWEGARGVGNILRHQYDGRSDLDCWTSILDGAPKLRQAALDEIKRLENLPPTPGG
jgi:uncharacterized protein with HEPN domain